ncbi:MAG TPA: GxxExxY protein [Chloroflexi bacterium]|nr:GxxExxY protein [Chloroflexota bacterium]
MEDEELTKKVIGCAFKVHNSLGSGFLEKVYENALRIELSGAGLRVEQQRPIQVYYQGEVIGDFVSDLLVEKRLVVELKAIEKLTKLHEAQLVNYLTATGLDIGLLINFGKSVQIKQKYKNFKPKVNQKIADQIQS